MYELEVITFYKIVRKIPTKKKKPFFSLEFLPIYVLKVIEKEYLAHC